MKVKRTVIYNIKHLLNVPGILGKNVRKAESFVLALLLKIDFKAIALL